MFLGGAVVLAAASRGLAAVDFVKDVQPILETNCVSCHSADNAEGDFDLSTRVAAFESGSDPPAIVPKKPEESALYKRTIVPKDDETLMPPAEQGGPLDKAAIETLRVWIAEGANWPNDIVLKARAKKPGRTPNSDDLALVRRIHARIVAQAKSDGKFADYSAKVPNTGAPYHMVAIKGGEFMMGSPEQEQGRESIEGPQTSVKVSSFWIGKYEVTWDEYEPYMITTVERFKNGTRKDFNSAVNTDVDAVTSHGPVRRNELRHGAARLPGDLHDSACRQ